MISAPWSALALAGGEEGFEEVRKDFGGDPYTVVAHVDMNGAVRRLRADDDLVARTALGHRVGGVDEEVHEDLTEPVADAPDRR